MIRRSSYGENFAGGCGSRRRGRAHPFGIGRERPHSPRGGSRTRVRCGCRQGEYGAAQEDRPCAVEEGLQDQLGHLLSLHPRARLAHPLPLSAHRLQHPARFQGLQGLSRYLQQPLERMGKLQVPVHGRRRGRERVPARTAQHVRDRRAQSDDRLHRPRPLRTARLAASLQEVQARLPDALVSAQLRRIRRHRPDHAEPARSRRRAHDDVPQPLRRAQHQLARGRYARLLGLVHPVLRVAGLRVRLHHLCLGDLQHQRRSLRGSRHRRCEPLADDVENNAPRHHAYDPHALAFADRRRLQGGLR